MPRLGRVTLAGVAESVRMEEIIRPKQALLVPNLVPNVPVSSPFYAFMPCFDGPSHCGRLIDLQELRDGGQDVVPQLVHAPAEGQGLADHLLMEGTSSAGLSATSLLRLAN